MAKAAMARTAASTIATQMETYVYLATDIPNSNRVGANCRTTGKNSAELAATPTMAPLTARKTPLDPVQWRAAKNAHATPAIKGT